MLLYVFLFCGDSNITQERPRNTYLKKLAYISSGNIYGYNKFSIIACLMAPDRYLNNGFYCEIKDSLREYVKTDVPAIQGFLIEDSSETFDKVLLNLRGLKTKLEEQYGNNVCDFAYLNYDDFNMVNIDTTIINKPNATNGPTTVVKDRDNHLINEIESRMLFLKNYIDRSILEMRDTTFSVLNDVDMLTRQLRHNVNSTRSNIIGNHVGNHMDDQVGLYPVDILPTSLNRNFGHNISRDREQRIRHNFPY